MNIIQLQAIEEFSISTLPVARCADGNGTLTPLFFSDHVLDIARAKAICAKCALREQCLSDAIEREEPWGVWGGELLSGGRIVCQQETGWPTTEAAEAAGDRQRVRCRRPGHRARRRTRSGRLRHRFRTDRRLGNRHGPGAHTLPEGSGAAAAGMGTR